MFDDKYGLTKAVLEGRKTMTRRVVPEKLLEAYYDYDDYVNAVAPHDIPCSREYEEEFFLRRSRFKVGDIVAVAQSYGAIVDDLEDPRNFSCMEHWESKSRDRAKYAEMAMYSPGGNNKMFVLAEDMPHQISITNVRVERMQDISDEDCFREGIFRFNLRHHERYAYTVRRKISDDATIVEYKPFDSPREAFASLIDKLSGKGTWESNPWVFVYEFELVK